MNVIEKQFSLNREAPKANSCQLFGASEAPTRSGLERAGNGAGNPKDQRRGFILKANWNNTHELRSGWSGGCSRTQTKISK